MFTARDGVNIYRQFRLVLVTASHKTVKSTHTHTHTHIYIYRVSQEEGTKLRESVP